MNKQIISFKFMKKSYGGKKCSSAMQLFKKYVRDTEHHAIVEIERINLCSLTFAVQKGLRIKSNRVYVNSRVVKHLYDQRYADEFHVIMHNLDLMVRFPEEVFLNAENKGDSFVFKKTVGNYLYCVIVEKAEDDYEVKTAFRTHSDYFKKYRSLWEWKGGNPSS